MEVVWAYVARGYKYECREIPAGTAVGGLGTTMSTSYAVYKDGVTVVMAANAAAALDWAQRDAAEKEVPNG